MRDGLLRDCSCGRWVVVPAIGGSLASSGGSPPWPGARSLLYRWRLRGGSRHPLLPGPEGRNPEPAEVAHLQVEPRRPAGAGIREHRQAPGAPQKRLRLDELQRTPVAVKAEACASSTVPVDEGDGPWGLARPERCGWPSGSRPNTRRSSGSLPHPGGHAAGRAMAPGRAVSVSHRVMGCSWYGHQCL